MAAPQSTMDDATSPVCRWNHLAEHHPYQTSPHTILPSDYMASGLGLEMEGSVGVRGPRKLHSLYVPEVGSEKD
ncbi:Hypothetical predicted protein [Pelobates cultripes]|uniref:Uncharacterized protein n=1 Tax=Pelobates cultripes TaxID=61616 RepID=A0AAD1TF95_PELCU|nr:Hypothetical predicted protein [Pelobates cultripes]